MSKIRVVTESMQSAADEMEALSRRITALQKQIASARRNINLNTGNAAMIRQSLNNQAATCERSADSAKHLAAALRDVIRQYERAERKVRDYQGEEGDSLRDKINALREKLKEIGGSLGMDSAALFSPDPVNLSNGNYVYEKTFYHYDTAISVNFRMFYNACETNRGSLGRGWRHSFERCLVEVGDEVRIRDVDGSVQAFRKVEKGRYVPFAGTFGTLVRNKEMWKFTDEQQDAYLFDTSGKLQKAVTPDGWSLALTYEQELPVGVTCSDGVTLCFAYNEEKQLAEIVDQGGRAVRFFYENAQIVRVEDPEGNTTMYEYDSDGRMCQITAPNGDLSVRNEFDQSGRTVRQEFADGGVMEYLYNEEPNAVVLVRQNGSRVTYYHDDQFRNTRTVYSDGEELITYNSDHQKTAIIDKLGRINQYRYDGQGRLKQMINAAGVALEYGYTSSGKLSELLLDGELFHTAEYDERGHQVKSVDANGGTVCFEYDIFGRVQSVTHEDGSKTSLEYDAAGNVVHVSDPVTGSTRYQYDVFRRVISSVDALGNETRYEYDKADRLAKVTNAQGHSRIYSYDRRGNLTRIVDFNGGITEVKYNNMNKPVCIIDPDGNTTQFAYDQMSNVIRKTAADGGITEMRYDSEGRMTWIRYPMGGEETAEYDPVGNLIKRCSPDGGTFLFQYDELNRPVQVTDPVGVVRRAEYNQLGKVTAVYYADGTEERFSYDKLGNCLTHTDQTGYCLIYRYNALGKILQISDEQGVLVEYTYGPGGQLLGEKHASGAELEYTYDPAGNVVCFSDNKNGTWNFHYDSLGQMCEAEHVGEGTEYYEYDPMGNICAVIDGTGNKTTYRYSKAGALEAAIDACGNETRYEYDPCYRLNKTIQPESGHFGADIINRLAQTTTYKWDLNGNLLSATDNMGGCVAYEYDACGRVIRKQDQDDHVLTCGYRLDGLEDVLSFSDGKTIRYQYDALKRLSQIEDWLGTTRMERDAAGRLTRVIEPDGKQLGYRWNERGQCTAIAYPDGNVHSYEYDRNTRLVGFVGGNNRIEYDYYDNGLLRQKKIPGAVSSHYGYDPAGRISNLDFFRNDQQTDSFAYHYDGCSRKVKITEQHAGLSQQEYGFAYTPVGSLKEVTKNGLPYQSFDYDVFGNRTGMVCNGKRTEYGYDPLGRLQWSKSDAAVKEYTYDKRGNLTSETVNGVKRLTMHFDALNRLSRAVSDAGTAEYTYNGMAMLTQVSRQTTGGVCTERLMFDYTGEGNRLLARNAERWENYGWDYELTFTHSENTAAYFLNDERMSAFGVLKGDNLQRYAYDPFGVAENMCLSQDTPVYTGYRYDPVTGYYDGGWRQYDPSNGRFVSRDPVAGALGNPITLNPYIYCMADPINNLDPTGRIAVWLASGIVGAVANVGVKLAGDVIKSVKNGEPSFSSWQSYVGSAAGGFVQGSVLVVAGPTAAGAAGAATETLIGNGLSMATGAKGYRKEDGYTLGTLVKDTAISTATGAATGFAFGKAAEVLKLDKITIGKGNYSAVWKQVVTKARRGIIKNITGSTLWKGLVSYGIVKTVDTIISKGWDELKEYAKEKIIDYGKEKIKEWYDSLINGGGSGASASTSIMNLFKSRNATCETT